MNFIKKNSFNRTISDYTLMILGSFLIAIAYALFINPYHIVPGGVFGVGVALHYLFPIFSVGTIGLILNIPLVILGMKILGSKFGVKTIIISVICSVMMNLCEDFIKYSDYFIKKDDPLGLGSDILLAVIFGAVIAGVGLGLIFRARGSSGGSDILALILAKYSHWATGRCQIIVDSMIVIVGFVVFRDWKIPLYSWMSIYIAGQVIDMTLKGISYDNALLIISEKHSEIAKIIMEKLERGATYINGNGAYTGEEKKIIYTVISRRELPILEYYIHQIDPDAFVTNIDAREILGDGFNSLTEKISG